MPARWTGYSMIEGKMSHTHHVRVYYEDTDLAGIVYYANHLKFIERARTEWVRGLGVDQTRLRAETGLVFAVRRVTADYLQPARFDDLLEVRSRVVASGGARMELRQEIWRGPDLLFSADVTLVCVTENGRPGRIPAHLRLALAPL